MEKKQFNRLIEQYLSGSATEDERVLVEEYLKRMEASGSSSPETSSEDVGGAMWQQIKERTGVSDTQVIPLRRKGKVVRFSIAVAASLIGLLLVGTYFWSSQKTVPEVRQSEVKAMPYKNDVLPGTNKAVLTLADGSTIVLDDAQNGALAQQGATQVIKLGSKLQYDPAQADAQEVLYNTIATPRGGQYQVELPDGTQVWLNAASSVRFPTAFAGKERRIEVTGEAYLEVAKDKAKPFIVSVNGAEVQVLGTHFNINAYADEAAVKTTLLEGSVRFVSGAGTAMLKPGEQSQMTSSGVVKVVSGVDVARVMAWKNGQFQFESADIQTVLRQISRWYDVEIVYQNKTIDDLFILEMPRSSKLSDVLKVLELTGNIRFEIEGKKIIVLP